jgi:hypothetical protein
MRWETRGRKAYITTEELLFLEDNIESVQRLFKSLQILSDRCLIGLESPVPKNVKFPVSTQLKDRINKRLYFLNNLSPTILLVKGSILLYSLLAACSNKAVALRSEGSGIKGVP